MKQFDFKEHAEGFDTHISRSIPGYWDLRELVHYIAPSFLWEGKNVYDLGCSTGKMLSDLQLFNQERGCSYVGYDIEPAFFNDKKSSDDINFFVRDITDPTLKLFNASLVLGIFILQFLEPKDRQPLINRVYEALEPGGAFIVAEKEYAKEPSNEQLFGVALRGYKRSNFTPEEILNKEQALQGFMRQADYNGTEYDLRCAGFNSIEVFWKSLGFTAYLAVK